MEHGYGYGRVWVSEGFCKFSSSLQFQYRFKVQQSEREEESKDREVDSRTNSLYNTLLVQVQVIEVPVCVSDSD